MVVTPRTELDSDNNTGDDDFGMGATDGYTTVGDTDGTTTAVTAINTCTVTDATNNAFINDTNTMPLNTLFADDHINSSACRRDICACANCSARQNVPCVNELFAMNNSQRPGHVSSISGGSGGSKSIAPSTGGRTSCRPKTNEGAGALNIDLKCSLRSEARMSQAGRVRFGDKLMTHEIAGYAEHYENTSTTHVGDAKWLDILCKC